MLKYILWLPIILVLSVSAKANDGLESPWIPGVNHVTSTLVGLSAAGGVLSTSDYSTVALHAGENPSGAMNVVKGSLTERVMDGVLSRNFLERSGKWISGTPARQGRAGIDGIYFQTDRNGNIRSLLVTEAKYGSSQLNLTKGSGRQMSQRWISQRLDQTSNVYENIADELRTKEIRWATGLKKAKATQKVNVPLKDVGLAVVWKSGDTIELFCADKNITVKEISKQAGRASQFLKGAAEGKVAYRANIIRYQAYQNKHSIILEEYDPVIEKVVGKRKLSGAFHELPREVRNSLRRSFIEEFMEKGYRGSEATRLAKQACDDPQFFKFMSKHPHYSARAGLDRFAGYTGMSAVVVGTLFDLGMQWSEGGDLDLVRTFDSGALSGISAATGYYSGSQISSALRGTAVGRNILSTLGTRGLVSTSAASLLGSVGGGFTATVVFAYGMWGMGYTDLDTAHLQCSIGLAGTAVSIAFYAGTMYAVTTFATAGTGVAIGSLGGAVATNAALAWLGGGTLAAGGGGVALGSVVLTGGAALVGVAVVSGITYVSYLRDLSKEKELIKGRMQIVETKLDKGQLMDWQAMR